MIEQELAKGLIAGDEKSFIELYYSYYDKLCRFCYKFIKDHDTSEEIVQDLIYTIWDKRAELKLNKNINAYLYRSVYNNAMYYIRKNKRIDLSIELYDMNELHSVQLDESIELAELQERIAELKKELPEQTSKIFESSRDEGLTYDEIAKKYSTSTKNVEYHMSKALKYFRNNLSDFFFILLILTMAAQFLEQIQK